MRSHGINHLARGRLAALAALAGLLAAYYATSPSLWDGSTWWDVSFLGLVLMPAVFGLVYLSLPLLDARGLLPLALAFAVLAAVTVAAGLDAVGNFAKLAAVTAVAFWLVGYLADLVLVVIVASIVPFVDAWSVWRGPTHVIVTQRQHLFTNLSFGFPLPGEHAAAHLGLPDLLFFAIFLATCVRFGLRTRWTWLAMTLSFGATLAFAVWLDLSGLPALPGLSIAFLGVNAHRIWRLLRPGRRTPVSGTAAN
jgi:hypothetical protein